MPHTPISTRLGAVPSIDWRQYEREDALRMVRGVRGLPPSVRDHLKDIRRGRQRRLAGTYPEVAECLVREGAEISDVIAFPQRMERVLLLLRIGMHRITVEDAQRDETAANFALDQAQLDYANDPSESHRIAVVEAAERQMTMTRQLALVLTAQEFA